MKNSVIENPKFQINDETIHAMNKKPPGWEYSPLSIYRQMNGSTIIPLLK